MNELDGPTAVDDDVLDETVELVRVVLAREVVVSVEPVEVVVCGGVPVVDVVEPVAVVDVVGEEDEMSVEVEAEGVEVEVVTTEVDVDVAADAVKNAVRVASWVSVTDDDWLVLPPLQSSKT